MHSIANDSRACASTFAALQPSRCVLTVLGPRVSTHIAPALMARDNPCSRRPLPRGRRLRAPLPGRSPSRPPPGPRGRALGDPQLQSQCQRVGDVRARPSSLRPWLMASGSSTSCAPHSPPRAARTSRCRWRRRTRSAAFASRRTPGLRRTSAPAIARDVRQCGLAPATNDRRPERARRQRVIVRRVSRAQARAHALQDASSDSWRRQRPCVAAAAPG